MCTKNVSLVDRIYDICFFPIVSIKSISIKEGKISYIEGEEKYDGVILLFRNHNTEKAFCKYERTNKQLYQRSKELVKNRGVNE